MHTCIHMCSRINQHSVAWCDRHAARCAYIWIRLHSSHTSTPLSSSCRTICLGPTDSLLYSFLHAKNVSNGVRATVHTWAVTKWEFEVTCIWHIHSKWLLAAPIVRGRLRDSPIPLTVRIVERTVKQDAANFNLTQLTLFIVEIDISLLNRFLWDVRVGLWTRVWCSVAYVDHC